MIETIRNASRRTLLSAILVVLGVLWSTPAMAVEFAFPFSYFDLEFGPALGFARIVDGSFFGGYDDKLWGPHGSYQLLSSDFDLVSGPLVDIVPGGDATYIHAPGGFLSIVFDFQLPGGSTRTGKFWAPLDGFTIHADGAGGGGNVFGELGPGAFDRLTASLLGIRPKTGATSIGLYLDSYDSYPEPDRVAKLFGYLDVSTQDAPEPSSALLLAGGLVSAWVWRTRGAGRHESRTNGR